MKNITHAELKKIAVKYTKSGYGSYLERVLAN
jgi:hypothetical protein